MKYIYLTNALAEKFLNMCYTTLGRYIKIININNMLPNNEININTTDLITGIYMLHFGNFNKLFIIQK